MRNTLRAVAAVAFLAGFYVVTVGAVAVLAFGTVHTALDAGPGRAAAATVALLGFVLIAVHAVSRGLRKPLPEPVGLPLERAHHPELWAEVDDLARRVGTRGPDEVRLVAEPAVRLTEDAGRLGLVGGSRRLTLGVPLLLTLSHGELRASVVHELAHLRPGFLGTSAVAHRGQVTLATLAERERTSSPLGLLMRLCARAYLAVAAPVSQHQEVRADELAARVAGTDAAASALTRVPAVQRLWEHYLTAHAHAAPGRRPLRLFEGFAALWAEAPTAPASPNGPTAPTTTGAGPAPAPPSAFDSHPGTADRLAHLETLAGGPGPTDPAPARQLVRRLGWNAVELETTIYRDSDLAPSTWQEIAEIAGPRAVLARASQAPGGLADCVADLTPHRAQRLTAGSLPDDATPSQVRTDAVELVTAVLESALLQRGQAWAVASWTSGWRLVDEDGRAVDLAAEVDAAYADDDAREALLRWVQTSGLAGYRAPAPGADVATGDPAAPVRGRVPSPSVA